MKKNFLLTFLAAITYLAATAQPCSLNNGTNCLCPDGTTACALLPDLVVAPDILLEPDLNPETNGQLRISVATPNIGYGPLEVHASDYFVCGTDTIYDTSGEPGECAATGSYSRQLVRQTVYSKDGSSIAGQDRWAGSMTYHPTHFHMHVDDWCAFSLRTPLDTDPNPLHWPIVAQGAKLGFCLMDYGSCNEYLGYCQDADGNVLNSDNIPNYGLGGGSYQCGFNQGISAGYTDIYHYYLDDMDIQIPENVCNGDYYLVVEVDPNNNFIESDETNNVTAVPFSLTQQNPVPTQLATATSIPVVCNGDAVQLEALAGDEFLWSNGQTTAAIQATETGEYSVMITTNCGSFQSAPIQVTVQDADLDPVQAINDYICQGETAQLGVNGAQGTIYWYDAPTDGNLLATTNTFETPVLTETTTYFAEDEVIFEGQTHYNEPHNTNFGGGGTNNATFNGFEIFDVFNPCQLVSIKVFLPNSGTEGNRTFQLRGSDSLVLQEITAFVPHGESRVTLNFDLQPGTNYQLGTAQHPGLWRTNTNVVYPYTIDGLLAITASNYDTPGSSAYYYYYFYDWEVKENDLTCHSTTRIPVTAGVNNGSGSVFTPEEVIPNVGTTVALCQGGETSLTAIGGDQYLWSNGETTQTIAVTQGGQYNVSVTFSCGTAVSDIVQVQVLNPAITQLSIDTVVCIPAPATLSVQVPAGIVRWYDTPIGGAPLFEGTVFVTPPIAATTIYYAENEISLDNTVCVASNRVPVTAYFDADCSGVGIGNAEQLYAIQGLKIQPNPNSGVFSMQFFVPTTQNIDVALADISGRILFKQSLPSFVGAYMHQFNENSLSAGVYLLYIQSGNEKQVQKVVVY